MAVTFRIPSALRPFAGGCDTVRLDGSPRTAGAALEALWAIHPELRLRIVTEQGDVRPHVNVFVGTDSIKDLEGLATPVADGAEIAVIPAVSGGSIVR
jgi:molybdopterin synthase sulfur carrier subunit